MASQGRCSAMLVVALLLVSAASVAHGATHTVGGPFGWGVPGTFNRSLTYLSDWASNQTFVAGDTVLFNYSAAFHDVLTVTAAAYAPCTLTSPLLMSKSGNDSLVLAAGPNYYICGTPTHCAEGQKIMLNATAAPPGTITPPASPGTPAGSDAAGTTVTVVQVMAAAVVALVGPLAFW